MNWNPFTVEETSNLLKGQPNWFFAGGYSIDLFLGYKTRDHGDIDVGVLEPHATHLFNHLQSHDLQIYTAEKGVLTKFKTQDLNAGGDNFWVSDGESYRLQVLTYPVKDNQVIFKRNNDVRFPVKSFSFNIGSHRILNPMVTVLFKATVSKPEVKDLKDIESVLNIMPNNHRNQPDITANTNC